MTSKTNNNSSNIDSRPLPPPPADSNPELDNQVASSSTMMPAVAARKKSVISQKVRVAVRVRPMNTTESSSAEIRQIVKTPSVPPNTVIVDGATPEQLANRRLTKSIVHGSQQFDGFYRVFGPHTEQEDVFEQTARDIICDSFEGKNGSVMAYGPTGAGKTHSIFGSGLSSPGILPRAAALIFRKRQELENFEGKYVSVKLWFVEVYNEEVRDLLNCGNRLQLRDRVSGGVGPNGASCEVAGVRMVYPDSADQMLSLIEKGFSQRISHETAANQHSSRSHAILSIDIEVKDGMEATSGLLGKMKFCDLAGSERAAATKNDGMRFREGANINKSLLALGAVVQALAKPNALQNFIPYRGSKLTRLLRESIGGNCSSILLVCVSPSSLALEETLNTMHYATLAKKINTEVRVNAVEISPEVLKEQFELALSKKDQEIDALKQELKRMYAERIALGLPPTSTNVDDQFNAHQQNNNNIHDVGSSPHVPVNVSPPSQQRGAHLRSLSGNQILMEGGEHLSPASNSSTTAMSPERMLEIATARLRALNKQHARDISTQTMSSSNHHNHHNNPHALGYSVTSLDEFNTSGNISPMKSNENNNRHHTRTESNQGRLSLSSMRQPGNNGELPPLGFPSNNHHQNHQNSEESPYDRNSNNIIDDEEESSNQNNRTQQQMLMASNTSPLDALLAGSDLARSSSASLAFKSINARLNELREFRENIHKENQIYGEASDLNLETAIRVASSEVVTYLGTHHVSKSEELDENGNVIVASSLIPVGIHGLQDEIATKRVQRTQYEKHREEIQRKLLEYNNELAAVNREIFQCKEFASELERHELKHRIELQKERMACLEAQEFAGFYLEEKKREHQLNNEFREALSRCGDILQRYLDILSFSGTEKDMDEFEKNAKYRREVQSLLESLRAPVTETESMVDVAVDNFDDYCRFNAELMNQFKITLEANVRKSREKKKLMQKIKHQLIASESNVAGHDEELEDTIENTLKELRLSRSNSEKNAGNNNDDDDEEDEEEDMLNNTQSALDRARLRRLGKKSAAVDVLADDENTSSRSKSHVKLSSSTSSSTLRQQQQSPDDPRDKSITDEIAAKFERRTTLRPNADDMANDLEGTTKNSRQNTATSENSTNNNDDDQQQQKNNNTTTSSKNNSNGSSPVPFHMRVKIPAHLDVTQQHHHHNNNLVATSPGTSSKATTSGGTMLWNNQNVPLSTINAAAATSSSQRRAALLVEQQQKQRELLAQQQQQPRENSSVSQAFWGNSTRRSRNALAHQVSLKASHTNSESMMTNTTSSGGKTTGRVSSFANRNNMFSSNINSNNVPDALNTSDLAKSGGVMSADEGQHQQNQQSLSIKSPMSNIDDGELASSAASTTGSGSARGMGPAERAALARATEANAYSQNHYSSGSGNQQQRQQQQQQQQQNRNSSPQQKQQQPVPVPAILQRQNTASKLRLAQHQNNNNNSNQSTASSSPPQNKQLLSRTETSPRVGTGRVGSFSISTPSQQQQQHKDPNDSNSFLTPVRTNTNNSNNNNNNNSRHNSNYSRNQTNTTNSSTADSNPASQPEHEQDEELNTNDNNDNSQQNINTSSSTATATTPTGKTGGSYYSSAPVNRTTPRNTNTTTRTTSSKMESDQSQQQNSTAMSMSPTAGSSSPSPPSSTTKLQQQQQRPSSSSSASPTSGGTLAPFTFEKPNTKDNNTSVLSNTSFASAHSASATTPTASTSGRPVSGRVSAAQLRQQQQQQQNNTNTNTSLNTNATDISTTSSNTTTTATNRSTATTSNLSAPSNPIDKAGVKRVSDIKEAFKKQMEKHQYAAGSGNNHHNPKSLGGQPKTPTISSSSATTTTTSAGKSFVHISSSSKSSNSYAVIHGGGQQNNNKDTTTGAPTTPTLSSKQQQAKTATNEKQQLQPQAPLVIDYNDKRTNRLMDKLTKNAPGVPLTFPSAVTANNNNTSTTTTTTTSKNQQQQSPTHSSAAAVAVNEREEQEDTVIIDDEQQQSSLNNTTNSLSPNSTMKNENVQNISAFQNLSALTVADDDDDEGTSNQKEEGNAAAADEDVAQSENEHDNKSLSPDPRIPTKSTATTVTTPFNKKK